MTIAVNPAATIKMKTATAVSAKTIYTITAGQ